MIKYVKISKCLPRISKAVLNQADRLELLSDALEGYRELEFPIKMKNNVTLVELQNHKAVLPQDAREINFVTYMASDPSETDCSELSEAFCDPEIITEVTETVTDGSVTTTTTTTTAKGYTLAHKLTLHNTFYSTGYFQNNFVPLKYVQGGYTNNNCDGCINKLLYDCTDTFSVDSNGIIWSSIKDGFLCLDYDSELKEDGEFLVIDDNSVLNYIATYAEYKHFETRSYMHEQGVERILGRLERRVEMLYKKAIGALMQRGLNRRAIGELTNNSYNTQIFRFLPDNWRRKFEPYRA